MRRVFIVLIIGLAAHSAKAQNDSIQSFIYDVYKQVVDTSYRYYNILNEAKPLSLRKADLEEYLKYERPDLLRELQLADFENSDTLTLKWSHYGIPKGKFLTRDQLPVYTGHIRILRYVPITTSAHIVDSLKKRGIIAVPIKNERNKRLAEIAKRTAIDAFDKRIPREDKNFYVISRPLFSHDFSYALLKVDESGRGCTYLFKMTAGGWKLILEMMCWVS